MNGTPVGYGFRIYFSRIIGQRYIAIPGRPQGRRMMGKCSVFSWESDRVDGIDRMGGGD